MNAPASTPAAPPVSLTSERLLLRPWRAEDRAPFAALNADPEVMAHFPAVLTQEQSDHLVALFQADVDARGWGPWAAERRDTGAFIGFIGLRPAPADLEFSPAVEVGWRLGREHWGQGLATEGARAAVGFGLSALGLERIVSFTACTNTRSEAVMRRLGMSFLGEFDHPRLPAGHALRRHVLYELRGPARVRRPAGDGPAAGEEPASVTRAG